MQVPIPDDWDGVSFCRWAVCWPDSIRWKAILYGLIENPNNGRFWDFATGDFLALRAAFKPAYDYNFDLEGVIMACGDNGLSEVAAAIRSLAVNNSDCGCGSVTSNSNSGVVVTLPDAGDGPVPVYGTEPVVELPEGEVPPGYPGDVAAYDADKCSMANTLVSGWITTIRALGFLDYVGTTGVILGVIAALAGIIVLPEVMIPVLIGAAIIGSIDAAIMTALADKLEESYDDIVCGLYNSRATDGAAQVISDALDVALAAISVTGFVGAALKTIGMVLMNSNTINQLFTLLGRVGGEKDCGTCGCNLHFLAGAYGTADEPLVPDGRLITITPSVVVGGTYNGQYIFNIQGGCGCFEPGVRLVIEDLTGYVVYSGGGTGDAGDKGGGILDCSSAELWGYAEEAAPGSEYCGVNIFQLGPQVGSFSVQIRLYADEGCS